MYKPLLRTFTVLLSLVLSLGLPMQAADLEHVDTLIVTKDPGKIKEAINLLDGQLQTSPEDGEALWLMAKAHLYLGDQTAEDDGRLEVFETGKDYADLAVEFFPESPHPHYWQSTLIGRIGQTQGILSSLFMVRPMKEALVQTLELDANYADAHWVLSQLYHQAPGFPLSIGNKKSSLQHAEKSIELDPANLEYQLQLAVALEYNGQKEEAISLLERILEDPALQQEPDLKEDAQGHYADFTK